LTAPEVIARLALGTGREVFVAFIVLIETVTAGAFSFHVESVDVVVITFSCGHSGLPSIGHSDRKGNLEYHQQEIAPSARQYHAPLVSDSQSAVDSSFCYTSFHDNLKPAYPVVHPLSVQA